MKFSRLRPALAAGVALTLAACGGGGKATYPINVQVYGLEYPGLVLSTNGQDLAVTGKSDYTTPIRASFPNKIEYGEVYNVLPKGVTDNVPGQQPDWTTGQQPAHQTCTTGAAGNPRTSTAGLLASIDVVVVCNVNAYPISGLVKGLTGEGLVLINGSEGISYPAPVLDATTKQPTDVPFAITTGGLSLARVTYGKTYGVQVQTQPKGQVCTVKGGNSPVNNGSGTIDDAIEKAGGVGNIEVNCTAAPAQ